MLLTGKWRDYYDSVARTTGVDKQVVYHREMRQFDSLPPTFAALERELTSNSSLINSSLLQREGRVGPRSTIATLAPMLVGFCGKVYPWYYYEVPKDKADRQVLPEAYTGYSDNADFFREQIRSIRAAPSRMPRRSRFDRLVERVESKSDWLPLFNEVEAPVWIMHQRTHRRGRDEIVVTVNPCLEEIEFYRLIDPYTAFQELYQFVGGVLNQPERETVDVSDKQLAEAKGFDKWSFRKLPTKRKQRK